MKKLLSRITIALFVTLYACYPVHVMAEGRYQGISSEGSTPKIFVLDSKTGKVKYCTFNKHNITVFCTDFSDK